MPNASQQRLEGKVNPLPEKLMILGVTVTRRGRCSKIFPVYVNWVLGGGFKDFYFHPYLGKIPILKNMFQMG